MTAGAFVAYALNITAGLVTSLAWLRFLSPYHYSDAQRVLTEGTVWWHQGALLAAALGLRPRSPSSSSSGAKLASGARRWHCCSAASRLPRGPSRLPASRPRPPASSTCQVPDENCGSPHGLQPVPARPRPTRLRGCHLGVAACLVLQIAPAASTGGHPPGGLSGQRAFTASATPTNVKKKRPGRPRQRHAPSTSASTLTRPGVQPDRSVHPPISGLQPRKHFCSCSRRQPWCLPPGWPEPRWRTPAPLMYADGSGRPRMPQPPVRPPPTTALARTIGTRRPTSR